MYLAPEEKLWYVIKHYHGSREVTSTGSKQASASGSGQRIGLRLEKNDIVKFGRVRLRVRDIDYADKDESPASNALNNSQTPGARRATQDGGPIVGGGSNIMGQSAVDINEVDIEMVHSGRN